MSFVGERPTHALRQRRVLAGVGAAAGGMLVATLLQLAAAPSAQADSNLTDIISAIDYTDTTGQTLLGDAATLFAEGDVHDGLATGFTGLDDILFNAQDDLFVDGYQALQGIDGPYGADTFGYLPVPTDLAAASTDAAEYGNYAQGALTTAEMDFGTGDFGDALGALTLATENWVAASQIELIGLVDTLVPIGMT
jgi:hypothetical protein